MSDVSCLVNYKIQKMKKLRLFFVTLFFVLTNISSLYSATTYPIQLTAQLLPPYGNRLSDYVVDGMERINITALQRDLSWGYYDFYLQMQVKQGSNILLSASAQYKIAPGFVTQLQANALFSRLAEVKTSRPQIIENGFCLPEGAYEFVFQAFDATKRNLPVSEPAYCYAYLSKMQPCRCLVPADNSCVDYTSPTLNFMWLEPTVAMPSASKKYELEIYEMPQGFDPIRDNAESLLQSLEPIYTKSDISSDMTMAQVPQTAGLFVKGRSYVWRVRTRFGEKYTETTTGSYKLSNYIENNGYSKISTFHFKKCMGQEDIWSEKKKVIATDPTMKVDIDKVETDKSKVDVVWTNDDKFTCGYVVEWNLADTTKSPWGKISVGAGNSRCEIKGVRHGIEYVTRVRGMVCPKEGSKDTIYSAYSDTLHFLWEKEKGEYCGREVPVLQGSISLKSLQPGDWFTANGNDIKVLSCEMNTAGDTTFSGKGQVSYGFLTNVVSLMVEFNNVKINEQGELMEGVVYSVTDLNNCVDFNLNGLANKNSAGSGPAQMQSDFDFSNGFKDGSVGVEMRGETTTLVAKDGNGGSYEIGQLVEQEPINCAPKSNIFDDEQGLVKFAPQEAWNPPFDYEQGVFTKSLSISDYYEKIDRYSIPWIAVPSGESTKIYANLNLSAGVVKPEHVYFICRTNSKAIKLKAEKLDGNQFVVPIFGGEAGKYLELVAMADTSKNGDADCSQLFTLGRAKVLSMKKESYTLHIVPFRRGPETVNGTSIENTLNEIYKPLGKTFTVVVEDRFGDGKEYDFLSDGLSVEGTEFMTTETKDMASLKSLYDMDRGFSEERNHAYLFILPKAKNSDVKGDMPRNKPVGYVFDEATGEFANGNLVAHEIGHGLFTFDHAFEYYSKGDGPTDNLMDYYDDKNLKVWQWNIMDTHKDYVLPFLEDDEDAMWTTDGHYYLFTYLGLLKGILYKDAELYGEYAERPDTYVITPDKNEIEVGNDKIVKVDSDYFVEGDVLSAHKPTLAIHQPDNYYLVNGKKVFFGEGVTTLHEWNDITLTDIDVFNGYVTIGEQVEMSIELSDGFVVGESIPKHTFTRQEVDRGEALINGKKVYLNAIEVGCTLNERILTSQEIKNKKVVIRESKPLRLFFKTKGAYMAENNTWVIGRLQQRNHALTSGYHGVELAVTSYAISNSAILGLDDDLKKYLLHRFGDVFAHFKYDGQEAMSAEELKNSKKYTDTKLDLYIDAFQYFIDNNVKCGSKKYEQIELEEDGLYQDGNIIYSTYDKNKTCVEIIKFLLTTVSTIKRYEKIGVFEAIGLCDAWLKNRDFKESQFYDKDGYSYISLWSNFREYYSFAEFQDLLLSVINQKAYAKQNDRRMYGDAVTCVSDFTTGHSEDGTSPDNILERSELFMLYVKRANELLSIITKNNGSSSAVDQVQSVVEWGLEAVSKGEIDVTSRLDGVFAFLIECEKHKEDDRFIVYIPIKFLPEKLDEVGSTTWLMYSKFMEKTGNFNWDFTASAENQEGVLRRYLQDKGYYVDKYKKEKGSSYKNGKLGLLIRKKNGKQ